MQSRSSYPKCHNTQPLNRRHNSASDRGATRPTSNLEPGTRLHATVTVGEVEPTKLKSRKRAVADKA